MCPLLFKFGLKYRELFRKYFSCQSSKNRSISCSSMNFSFVHSIQDITRLFYFINLNQSAGYSTSFPPFSWWWREEGSWSKNPARSFRPIPILPRVCLRLRRTKSCSSRRCCAAGPGSRRRDNPRPSCQTKNWGFVFFGIYVSLDKVFIIKKI